MVAPPLRSYILCIVLRERLPHHLFHVFDRIAAFLDISRHFHIFLIALGLNVVRTISFPESPDPADQESMGNAMFSIDSKDSRSGRSGIYGKRLVFQRFQRVRRLGGAMGSAGGSLRESKRSLFDPCFWEPLLPTRNRAIPSCASSDRPSSCRGSGPPAVANIRPGTPTGIAQARSRHAGRHATTSFESCSRAVLESTGWLSAGGAYGKTKRAHPRQFRTRKCRKPTHPERPIGPRTLKPRALGPGPKQDGLGNAPGDLV